MLAASYFLFDDLTFVFILYFVLLFHELGHYSMMKLFGWKSSDVCLMMVIWVFSLSVTIFHQCISPSVIFVQRHLTVSNESHIFLNSLAGILQINV